MNVSIICLDDGSAARVAESADDIVTRATTGDRWLCFTDPGDDTEVWVCNRRMTRVLQEEI